MPTKTEQRELDRYATLCEERAQAFQVREATGADQWPVEVEPVTPVSPRKYRDAEQVAAKIALFEQQLAKRRAGLAKRGWEFDSDAIDARPVRKREPEPKLKTQQAPPEPTTEDAIRARIAEAEEKIRSAEGKPEFARIARTYRGQITRLRKRLPTSNRPDPVRVAAGKAT